MVRLGVISDTHDARFPVERFLQIANRERYDAVFHLGDGAADVRWLRRRLDMPLMAVAGNCDFRTDSPGELVMDFEGCRILAVHGHRQDVKWGMDRLSYCAQERGARIALYGHTHVPGIEYCGPVLTVNPGALMRGEYAELVIDGDRAVPYLKSI